MHVETDSRLLSDPLWSTLNQAIQRIKTDPSRFLCRADPDSPRGLAVAEINRLAGGDGPVFTLVRPRLSDRAETWTLTVHHPAPAVEVVEWRQSTFDARPSVHKIEMTLAFLAAWRDQRGRVVKPMPDAEVPVVAADKAKPSDEVGLTGEEKALALLVSHPEWSDTRIAEAVPCARTTLYKWNRFAAARETLKSGRDRLPHGEKDRETGKIEAWEP